jgi:hypothetical protein
MRLTSITCLLSKTSCSNGQLLFPNLPILLRPREHCEVDINRLNLDDRDRTASASQRITLSKRATDRHWWNPPSTARVLGVRSKRLRASCTCQKATYPGDNRGPASRRSLHNKFLSGTRFACHTSTDGLMTITIQFLVTSDED